LVGEAEVDVVDLNEYEIPIYSKARQEAGGIPALAQQLFDKCANRLLAIAISAI
ncbi:MAG: NAD(P)H-dependent oxidoreductase, partial [Moorea sp. SIO2B7]|nr:NAD(P)H-dependent oxidoreductase [Moorena sp. SIO2B7]